MRKSPRSLLIGSLCLAALVAGVWLVRSARAVEPVPIGRSGRPVVQPVNPPGGMVAAGADTARIADLGRQLKALREEFHGKLDPLQAQVKALKDDYEPRIKVLEAQRHDLVEAGKPQAIQQLDRQEDGELAALADKEKSEHERVRQQYAQERKDVQARFAKLRSEAARR
jgi:hypothetical protein